MDEPCVVEGTRPDVVAVVVVGGAAVHVVEGVDVADADVVGGDGALELPGGWPVGVFAGDAGEVFGEDAGGLVPVALAGGVGLAGGGVATLVGLAPAEGVAAVAVALGIEQLAGVAFAGCDGHEQGGREVVGRGGLLDAGGDVGCEAGVVCLGEADCALDAGGLMFGGGGVGADAGGHVVG